jgi:hypothetical protein
VFHPPRLLIVRRCALTNDKSHRACAIALRSVISAPYEAAYHKYDAHCLSYKTWNFWESYFILTRVAPTLAYSELWRDIKTIRTYGNVQWARAAVSVGVLTYGTSPYHSFLFIFCYFKRKNIFIYENIALLNSKVVWLYYLRSRWQWPRGLTHEPSPSTWTLGSWVRNPLEAGMSVCVYSMFMLFCV